MDNKLYRSSDERIVAGVCAGIARKMDWNMTGLRWAFVLVSLFLTGLPVVVYAVLWLVLQERSTAR